MKADHEFWKRFEDAQNEQCLTFSRMMWIDEYDQMFKDTFKRYVEALKVSTECCCALYDDIWPEEGENDTV